MILINIVWDKHTEKGALLGGALQCAIYYLHVCYIIVDVKCNLKKLFLDGVFFNEPY